MTVEASDGRGQTANGVATIKVDRDEEPPYFDDAPYTPGTVSENVANNSRVFTVKGKDDDKEVRPALIGFGAGLVLRNFAPIFASFFESSS